MDMRILMDIECFLFEAGLLCQISNWLLPIQTSTTCFVQHRPEDVLSKQHAGFMSLRPLYSLGQMQRLLTLHWFDHGYGTINADLTIASKELCKRLIIQGLFIKFKASSRTWVWGKGLVGFFGGYHLSKEVSWGRIQLPKWHHGSTAIFRPNFAPKIEESWTFLDHPKDHGKLCLVNLWDLCWKTPTLTTRSPIATCDVGNPTMVDRRGPALGCAMRQVSNVCGQYQETVLLAACFHILKYFWGGMNIPKNSKL